MNSSEDRAIYKGYEIVKTLAKNERHEIIKAIRISDSRQVVIKQPCKSGENSSLVLTLGHEFDMMKDLDHHGIPDVYEILSGENSFALVLEFLEGKSLRELIFKKKLSNAEILDIAIQMADLLQYLKQAGIIHKDINSSNVLITNDGSAKLLDFGISTNLNSEINDMQNVDQIEGTLIYLSPEQTGRTAYSVTHSSDFYSLGVLLYELLSGKPPFDSIDPLEIIHFHLSRNPIPLSSLLPDIPKGLEQIVFKLMEKNPDDRYQSAAGLKADLELVRKHYHEKIPLSGFRAGLYDTTEQYKQSQKLYGREDEISELLTLFREIDRVKSMLVLVSGYSGVGKSALIRHIKFPIIQSRGTFISGKFDQFKKDIPYFAFIQAFEEFIKNLLSESEEQIKFWKHRISNALGANAGLITEVIPQLSKILEKQPEVPKLQPAEQEARFHMVLLDFIYAFSTVERPLVVFLDDLQWADLPSLNLVKRLLENPRQESILLLGAYRNNEVEKGHPLLLTIRQIEESSGQVKVIQLEPLSEETTSQITADSFGMNEQQAGELGHTVFSKTKGNPFFIHSFLKSLFDKKLIRKDQNKTWIWSRKEIDNLGYTDNVVDLMTEGLINLPIHTQAVLKQAAALGSQFNLADLSAISEKNQWQVYTDLKPALKGGYLNSMDNNYKALALRSIDKNFNSNQFPVEVIAQFTFTHDKVQQAAYGLISPAELAFDHLKIGRLLLKTKTESQLQEDIFELLNHFALSLHLIETEKEKKRITELCLLAGRKAKDSTSYNLGVRFLSMGKSLLGTDSWSENYGLTYDVLFELGECEYLNDNPVVAEAYFKEILGHSRTNFEKLRVYYLHSSLYLKIGNTNESLRLGLEAVKLYDIHFPQNKMAIQLAAMVNVIKYLFLFSTKYRNPERLFQLKASQDEEIIALNKFLIDLATSAYQQDQNLMMLVIFRIIGSFLRHGFTDASGWGFSGFSVVVLSAFNMQKRGFNLWDLTIKLHQRTSSPLIKWRLSYTVLCFHNHWRIPNREGYDGMLETIKACVLNGDQIFTGYTVALYLRTRVAAGENLKEIIESSEDHFTLIKNGDGGLDFFQCFYQLAKALNGKTNEDSWNDKFFNGEKTLEKLNLEGNKTKLAFFHSAHCYLLYFLGRYREALEESHMVTKYSDNFVGDILQAFNAFYTSLSISACFETLNPREKKKYLKIFKKHLHDMKSWAKGCPENYSQHYTLLQAEYQAMNSKTESALKLYEKSIRQAIQNKSKNIEAIANERAAILCFKSQLTKQGQLFLTDAWQAYHSWDAILKCRQLELAYPDFFRLTSNTEAELNVASHSATSRSNKISLDLASVLKASQSIASQVKYEELLKKLLHITIENAGAERGTLLLRKGNLLCVEAVGISGNSDIEIIPSTPLDQTNLVPKSIINYCWRNEEIVVITDASADDHFSSDSYIQENGTRSVMCLPINSQGRINGLLYLENKLLKGVFSKDRIDLLQMLSGQIGISIENSILYENLEEKVLERTKEIEKALIELKVTQKQLIQSEKMASLGELTAGIAHEIQNPLNFVNNFSEVSTELIDEMNDEINHGNIELAKEIASDLRQNLEKINHHGKRAGDIVKGMLQHSRSSSGEKEPANINALVDEYLDLAYQGLRAKDKSFNATLKTDFDESIGKIDVIPQDMGRVILNLFTNAFYAVNEKSIQGIAGFEPTVSVSTKKVGNKVLISVKDNGNGIPQKVLDKIFQPFFTTKPTGQGTGLGLSLAYDIVKAHGGELKVETNEGEGTEFMIQIPI